MSDVEVVVTREADLDRILGQASRMMLTALVREAANRAIDRAPVDKGTMRRTLSPQSATYDGARIPTWASFGPKVNAVPYAGYLNAGEYVRKSGKPAPSAPLYRWAKRRGIPKAAQGQIVRAIQRKQARRGTFRYHYVSGPLKGKSTKGWFDPGVADDLRNLQYIDAVVRDTAAWVAAQWGKG